MTDNRIQVLIADDHSLFRKGLIELLNKNSAVRIIADAANGAELKDLYLKYRPHIMLVDISMPDISGIDAVSAIRKSDKNAKALFLSMYTAEEYIYQAYKAGGKGLIGKNTEADVLVKAIIDVYNGKLYFGKDYNTGTLERLAERYEEKQSGIMETIPVKQEYDLTKREYEVLEQVSYGYSNEQIAQKVNISRKTAEKHRSNIRRKYKIKSLSGFIKFAIEVTSSRKNCDKPE